VEAIWISPFFKSPMSDFGYDVSDYCDVDPIFGTLEDFDALLAKAHSLGLKVIIDQVYAPHLRRA
jgi:alpha-glucosidase